MIALIANRYVIVNECITIFKLKLNKPDEMSKPIELNDNNFSDEVESNEQPVLVDFWAEWCGPCRMVGPVVEELAGEYEGKAKVGKVNVDHNPQVSVKYGIRSIPALLIFKNGEVVDQIIGAVPKTHIKKQLDAQLA